MDVNEELNFVKIKKIGGGGGVRGVKVDVNGEVFVKIPKKIGGGGGGGVGLGEVRVDVNKELKFL